jgi:hypothetical protein
MLPPRPDVCDLLVFPQSDVVDHDNHELDAAIEPHHLPTLDPSQWLVLPVQKIKGPGVLLPPTTNKCTQIATTLKTMDDTYTI